MTSEARITANRLNAQASTGPRSAEGKSRVSKNSVKLGLFTARDLILPEEQPEYDELRAALEAELLPATVMERTLAMEILHATWRLRRCALTEAGLDFDDPEAMAETQAAIDRARAHARNNLHRATADLSRLQTERHLRAQLAPEVPETLVSHQAISKALASDTRRRQNQRKLDELDSIEAIFAAAAGLAGMPAFDGAPKTPESERTPELGTRASHARSNNPPITKQTQSPTQATAAEDPQPGSEPDSFEGFLAHLAGLGTGGTSPFHDAPGTPAFQARPSNIPFITKQTQPAAPVDPRTSPPNGPSTPPEHRNASW